MANGKLPPKDTYNASIAYQDFYKTNGLTAKDHGTHNDQPSMTRQEFAEECDINTIMAKYDGYLSDPMASLREPMYIDFTAVPGNLMDAMNQVKVASDAFYRLPAVVRKEFDNDPVAFADFGADPANLAKMREWGLAAPEKPADKPVQVEVVSASGAGPAAPAPAVAAAPGAPAPKV